MKKKNTPLRDIVRGIKTNTTVVLVVAALLVIAAFVYIPTVKQELSPRPSEAGGMIDPGFGPGDKLTPWDKGPVFPPTPSGPPGWTIKQITDWPNSYERVDDSYNEYILFHVNDYTQWHDQKLCLYNINTEEIINIPKIDYLTGVIGRARIHGDRVVWAQDRASFAGKDIYMYSISSGVTTKITDDLHTYVGPDVFGDWVVYLSRGYNGWNKIKIKNIETGEDITIPAQFDHITLSPKIDNNWIVWVEHDPSDGLPHKAFSYNIDTGTITDLMPEPGLVQIETFDISGDVVVVNVYSPNFEDDLFTFNLATGELKQVTQGYRDYKPRILNNKVLYTRLYPDEIHLLDLITNVNLNLVQDVYVPHYTITMVNGKTVLAGTLAHLSEGDIYIVKEQ